jgi:hypothetical protein
VRREAATACPGSHILAAIVGALWAHRQRCLWLRVETIALLAERVRVQSVAREASRRLTG